VKLIRQDDYDTYSKWYENETYGREAPSVRRRHADKIRRKDLAYENGGYIRVAPTIPIYNKLHDIENAGEVTT